MRIGCSAADVKEIKPERLKAILDSDKQGEFLLLDVRQPEEYQAGHIPGATLIPLGELEFRFGELDRSSKIVTYCRAGHRSNAAAVELCRLGFKDVYHLAGGILGWNYVTVTGATDRMEPISAVVELKDVLVLAMKLEKGGHLFYRQAMEKTSSPRAKAIFEELADVENAHFNKLYKQAVSLLGESALPPLAQMRDELKVEYMEGGIEITPALTRKEKLSGEQDALEIAIEKEYLSYDYYKRSASLVEKSEVKQLLHALASDERNHASLLLDRLTEILRY